MNERMLNVTPAQTSHRLLMANKAICMKNKENDTGHRGYKTPGGGGGGGGVVETFPTICLQLHTLRNSRHA